MKKKSKVKLPTKKIPLKKSLGDLMKDEDGFVSKETILKVGLSTVAALGVAGAMSATSTGQQPPTHTNYITTSANDGSLNAECAQHTNVTTHTSY